MRLSERLLARLSKRPTATQTKMRERVLANEQETRQADQNLGVVRTECWRYAHYASMERGVVACRRQSWLPTHVWSLDCDDLK